jgi:multicomponent Na+:H+ antiporter subunit F
MTIVSVTANIALFMLGVALALTVYRLVKGPTLPDRVIAVDLIGTIAVGMIAAYAIATHQSVFLRDAIVLAVVSFLGTISFAFYISRGGLS